MAIYRQVQMSFWNDTKVIDDFTPEDKLFYLYLMTNPHTNLCGCYQISVKQASLETGFSKETVKTLINRMKEQHKVIDYDEETKELLIINWHKYNWTDSEKFKKPLITEINDIKTEKFKGYLTEVLEGMDTVSIPYPYGMDTTVTVTVTDTVSVTDTDTVSVKEVIDYLNTVIGTNYKDNTSKTKSLIKARLNEGYTLDDFKLVIDKKARDWINDSKMQKYLRPETLFGTKFEGYLNEREKLTRTQEVDAWV